MRIWINNNITSISTRIKHFLFPKKSFQVNTASQIRQASKEKVFKYFNCSTRKNKHLPFVH